MSAYPNPTDADQIRRARLLGNLKTAEETITSIRSNLDRDRIYHVATDADELLRVATNVRASATAVLRETPWPGVPAIQAAAKQEANR